MWKSDAKIRLFSVTCKYINVIKIIIKNITDSIIIVKYKDEQWRFRIKDVLLHTSIPHHP